MLIVSDLSFGGEIDVGVILIVELLTYAYSPSLVSRLYVSSRVEFGM